jgi:hypothetical protein
MRLPFRPALPLTLAALLAGCGEHGVDVNAVESAVKRVTERCAAATPGDDARILAPAVVELIAQYNRHPRVTFRFHGGQADTSMRAQLLAARTTLWVCAPQLAGRIDAALQS